MSLVFSAIIPIFLLVALGAALKVKAGFRDDFWQMIEKLTFNGLFPALMFVKIAESDVHWPSALPIAAAIVIAINLTALAAIPFRSLLKLSPEKFVPIFQGGFRSNAYVGIAVVLGVLGDDATGAMAVSMLAVGVTINFLGVVGHLYWLNTPGQNTGLRGVAIDTVKNPLIQACILGALFNAIGWGLPPIIGPTLKLLSEAALPMGLMAVGAGLSLSALRVDMLPVIVSSTFKLLLQPLLTFGFCILFDLSGYALIVPVIFAALPTSATAYVVSRRMGSDAQLMAGIVTASHFAAIITLPILILMITRL